jgi:lambda repressor-like predicted transcriptional regulator
VRRYPLDALVRASGLTEAALARKVGLSGTTLKQARERGLKESAADRYAVRCGLHPLEVWPELAEAAEAVCAADDCDVRFVPSRKGHRYCSSLCANRRRSREWKRKRYAEDPEYAQARRDEAARYRAEARAYVNAQARRWRSENPGRVSETHKAWRERNREHVREAARRYYAENRERILAKQREYDRRKREEAA